MKLKTTLELDIYSRLPYGLKFRLPEFSDRINELIDQYPWYLAMSLPEAVAEGIESAIKLTEIELYQRNVYVAIEEEKLFLGGMETSLGFGMDDVFAEEVIPMLYPIEVLSKTIVHEGAEIVPIIELAKIAEPQHFNETNVIVKDGKNSDIIGCAWNKDGVYFALVYMADSQTFYVENDIQSRLYTANQDMLFDKLREWHINYRLEKGEYHPMTTLI